MDYYVERLQDLLKREKPLTTDDRLLLVAATALYMQAMFMRGVPYGSPDVPNMQSLLELAALEDNANSRQDVAVFIEGTLLPFYKGR